jgi:hypothetical protein
VSVTLNGTSQYLINSAPPALTYPYTLGVWVKTNSIAAGTANVAILATTSSSTNLSLYRSAAQWTMYANGPIVAIGAATVGLWTFLLVRYQSATNARAAMLDATGFSAHVSTTTAVSMTPTNWSLGAKFDTAASGFFDGQIAEFWITNTDVQPDGAQTSDALLRQLAYNGPFSVPHVASALIEYRSLKSVLSSDRDKLDEVYWGTKGRQTWVNTGGAILGAHPPLAPGYLGPPQVPATLILPG